MQLKPFDCLRARAAADQKRMPSEGDGWNANTRDPMLFSIPAGPGLYSFRLVYSAFPKMDRNGVMRDSDGVWSRTLSLAGEVGGANASRTLMSWGAWNETRERNDAFSIW